MSCWVPCLKMSMNEFMNNSWWGGGKQREARFITVKVTKFLTCDKGPKTVCCGGSLAQGFKCPCFCPLWALSKKHQASSLALISPLLFPALGLRGKWVHSAYNVHILTIWFISSLSTIFLTHEVLTQQCLIPSNSSPSVWEREFLIGKSEMSKVDRPQLALVTGRLCSG